MGTALTEAHLRELSRLTRNLSLCFDADAAGQEATIRGMELAIGQGFKIRIVTLPEGTDPADDPTDFESKLASADAYLSYRVGVEIDRLLPDRQRGFERVREILAPFPDSPDRQDAVRLAADRLGLPAELQAGLAPAARARGGALTTKALEAGVRLERNALAGVLTHPQLVPVLADIPAEQFDVELHRRVRDHLLTQGPTDNELIGAIADLDARAAQEALDETGSRQALLRLSERALERELAGARDDSRRTTELQQKLAKIRDAISSLG
jgi:DNA primase